jgi:antitoxin ParD1/3/4
MNDMALHIVSLSPELEQIVTARVENGSSASTSDVVRSGLRALEQQERDNQDKLAELRAAIEEGLASGEADTGMAARLDAYMCDLAKQGEVKLDEMEQMVS